MASKSITVSGITYPTVREAAKAYGLPHGNITRRLRTGWTIEQAFELEAKPQRDAHNAKQITTKKGMFSSVREAAMAYGINETTISQRLRLGWSDAQAVGDEGQPKRRTSRGNTVICEEKTYSSASELSDFYGLCSQKVGKRLRSGWTPEEAVGLKPPPPRFRNQDGSVRDHAWIAKTVTSHGETVPVSRIGKYTLYLLREKQTGREYVGITTGNIKTRLRGHWNLVSRGRHSKLYNRMRKALNEGRRNDFVIETIRNDARSYEELQEQEYQEIKKRNTIENGYNTAEGGSLGTPSPIIVDDKEFISHLAAAQHYGVDPHNFSQRISKLGWTPEQAAGLDPNKKYGIEVEVDGRRYASISQACAELGKSYKKVHNRLKKYGWSLEQAFDLKPAPKSKKPSNSKRIISSIGEFGSASDAAKVVGVKHGTITSRLRSGWTHDEALGLTEPPTKS